MDHNCNNAFIIKTGCRLHLLSSTILRPVRLLPTLHDIQMLKDEQSMCLILSEVGPSSSSLQSVRTTLAFPQTYRAISTHPPLYMFSSLSLSLRHCPLSYASSLLHLQIARKPLFPALCQRQIVPHHASSSVSSRNHGPTPSRPKIRSVTATSRP